MKNSSNQHCSELSVWY